MHVSYRWLSRHVDLEGIDAEQLAADLTLSTAEVEGVERFAPQLSDVIVGCVTSRDPHPDADKLSVCTVDVGDDSPLSIVCGAPNVAAGQKVAVATIGTVLPGDFKIKKSKIRGVESRGMICSVRELELGDEHDGIWVLPEQAETGQPVAAALGVEDWVIEIDNKSLTHRPDLWGHRGIAGEIAAIYRRELLPLDTRLPATGDEAPFPVHVESPACSRYLALRIDGARAEASPDWLRWLLLAVGQRPIDVIVDLSNFVMLDLGQPNHIFDASRLSSDGIRVRNARDGEHITTLDAEQRRLGPADLLICSGDDAVALAGVMGGEESKVGDDTSRLLLEVATFAPATVRRTSTRLGLRTDSSARFEKHLDPTLPMAAAGHFARLLQSLQPEVRFPAPITDAGEWQDPALELTLRPARVRSALGSEISDDDIIDILTRLGFDVGCSGDRGLRVGVPSARATKDVTIEQDLIEEVGRIHRYGNIPEQTMLAAVQPPRPDPRHELVRRIQDRLAGVARFHEVLSYSFISDATLERLGWLDEPHVAVLNPMAQDEARIRRSVLPTLLGNLEANRRHHDDIRLFEIGKGYRPEAANDRGEPQQVHQLALVWASAPERVGDRFDDDRFHQLLGVVADLLSYLGVQAADWSPTESAPAWAHPAQVLTSGQNLSASPDDEPLARVATLEPGLARAIGLANELASDVAVAEISIDVLLAAKRETRPYQPIPRYPGVKLDVAVDLPEQTPAAQLVQVISQAGKGQVADSELFDVYRGKNVDAGRKSLAYHVLLLSETKTLTDKDQAKFLTRLEKGLEALDARLRR
jgi:phenylalanyl-tRNA synthetase beta chain